MIRQAMQKDYNDIIKLNQADVEMLSPIDNSLLKKMDEISEVFEVIEIDDTVVAFILAFNGVSEYWGDNYSWFKKNYSNFIYIDRIVVDENYRNQRLAGKLYERIFEYALNNKYDLVCAEIDIEPEYNHPSMKFHEKMGFEEVGKKLWKDDITVSLQTKNI